MKVIKFKPNTKFKYQRKILIKNLALSLIFTYFFYIYNPVAPIWFYLGIFVIYLFFLNNIKNYDLKYLNKPHVIEKIIFKISKLIFSLNLLFDFCII